MDEFVAMRLHSGPMSTKYNVALRGMADATNGPLAHAFKKLCCSNAYTTTREA